MHFGQTLHNIVLNTNWMEGVEQSTTSLETKLVDMKGVVAKIEVDILVNTLDLYK